MDYCFIRRKVEEDTTTMVVIKDRGSRAIRAHALKFKGTCLDEASTLVSQAIQAFGHKGKLAIKTDNEPALLDLRNEVTKKLDEGILLIRLRHMSRQAMGQSSLESKRSRVCSECIC